MINSEMKLGRKFIKSIPMAICGLALGLAALGNLLKTYFVAEGKLKVADNFRYVCGTLAVLFLVIYFAKIFFDGKHAREELKTPIPASVLPTVTMAIMLLCTYVLDYWPAGVADIARAVWYTAVISQACMMVYFIKKYVLGGVKLATVFPSWFLIFVGIVVASVTAPAIGEFAVFIGQIAFYVGFVFYFISLPIVIAKMLKTPWKLFQEPTRPTIAIATAPMSLLIVGYFNSFKVMDMVKAGEQVNKKLIYFMLIVAAIMYLFVLAMMIPLLLKRFYPTYSSFTFPFVISALAFRLGAMFIGKFHSGFGWLLDLAEITQWISVAFILFVIAHYIRYFVYWLRF